MQLESCKVRCLIAVLVLAITCQGCSPSFALHLDLGILGERELDLQGWQQIAERHPEALQVNAEEGEQSLYLERVLWEIGAPAVETLTIDERTLFWRDIHDNAWLRQDGQWLLAGETFKAQKAAFLMPWEEARASGSVRDLAPTVTQALGLPAPEGAEGAALTSHEAPRVYIYAVDGLGMRYRERLIQNINSEFINMLGEPIILRQEYGAQGDDALASLMTGAPAGDPGSAVAAETLTQVVEAAGLESLVVAAEPLSPLEVDLGAVAISADGGPDGDLDAAVIAGATRLIEERNPNLAVVCVPGMLQTAQEFGLISDEALERAMLIDGYLERSVMTLPAGSLVIIMGSHGMHARGDTVATGSLMPEDIYVPVWIIQI